MEAGRTYKKLLLAAIVAVAVFAVDLLVTGLVYGMVFSRFDSESGEAISVRRTGFGFSSGDALLQGYFYPSEENTALVVLAPGFHTVQDDYFEVTEALLAKGYSVFTFDPTGCGESGGGSQEGFPQIITDLDACLDAIAENDRFGCEKLFLFGHSRGGYGACCVLQSHPEVDGAVCVGGVSSAMDGVMSGAYGILGSAAYFNYPVLALWQGAEFGETAGIDAVSSINGSGIPVLIVQGEDDARIPTDRFSVYSRAGSLSDNAELLLTDGGHVDSLYTDSGADAELMEKVVSFYRACD